MALEVDSVDSQSKFKRPLTLEIPSNSQLSLVESSLIPQTTTSSSSLLPTLNVKFAPLPQLSPRKRRSTIPLGMAGRGQLVPRRRGRKASPLWTDEGPEEYRLQQEELAARHARTSAYAAYAAARKEEEDELESDYDRRRKNGEQGDEGDPLHALGRIVKGASKTLWKRVSNKDVATAAGAGTATSRSKLKEGFTSGSPTLTKASPLPPRSILGTITSNTASNVDDHRVEEEEEEEGGVWEEEIGDTFLRHVSQTQTIVEGRVYSHFSSKVEALTRSPPPSPSVSNSKRMSSFTRPPSLKKVSPPFKAKQASS